jgi:hypothetical protein
MFVATAVHIPRTYAIREMRCQFEGDLGSRLLNVWRRVPSASRNALEDEASPAPRVPRQ